VESKCLHRSPQQTGKVPICGQSSLRVPVLGASPSGRAAQWGRRLTMLVTFYLLVLGDWPGWLVSVAGRCVEATSLGITRVCAYATASNASVKNTST